MQNESKSEERGPFQVYIGLGSNENNPVNQLILALKKLNIVPQTTVIKYSSFYWNTFLGAENEAECLNTVALIETFLLPEKLLEHMLHLEAEQGRVRNGNGYHKRTLDLDVLLYEDVMMDTQKLCIPHPRMLERAFVIVPLLEINPDLILPSGELLKKYNIFHDWQYRNEVIPDFLL